MRIRPSKHTGEVVMEVNRRDEPLLTEAVATPFRLKKILVPTDFSDCSKKAIQYALPLAQQHRSRTSGWAATLLRRRAREFAPTAGRCIAPLAFGILATHAPPGASSTRALDPPADIHRRAKNVREK